MIQNTEILKGRKPVLFIYNHKLQTDLGPLALLELYSSLLGGSESEAVKHGIACLAGFIDDRKEGMRDDLAME